MLSWFNYKSIASSLLKNQRASKKEIDMIISISNKNLRWKVKNAIKNITPPFLYHSLKRTNGF